jgi:hypothetical protein
LNIYVPVHLYFAGEFYTFSFENVQVVSPEFTFYDSSKLSMDDSLHIEKLLRAKMDFSFMFVFLTLFTHWFFWISFV